MHKPTLNNPKWNKMISGLENMILVATRLMHRDMVVCLHYKTNYRSLMQWLYYPASGHFDQSWNQCFYLDYSERNHLNTVISF